MTLAQRKRAEARELNALGDRLWRESDELLERSRLVKRLARQLEAEAEEIEDVDAVRAIGGEGVKGVSRKRRAA